MVALDGLPARNGGSELVDYSLKESNRRLILERRKVKLLADRTGSYSSQQQSTINFVIAPGSQDDWLDGRNSYFTATIQAVPTGGTWPGGVAPFLYLPNGPASCFEQVQIISASGQQLLNITDYGTLQQMFQEWTTCPTWKHGAGQIYGLGSEDFNDWQPAKFVPGQLGSAQIPATYNPYARGFPEEAYMDAADSKVYFQRPAGKSLNLQQNLCSSGVTFAFRLDLTWIFNNPTLLPSQLFPLQIRCTLGNPQQSLAYVGVSTSAGPIGQESLAPALAAQSATTGTPAVPASYSILDGYAQKSSVVDNAVDLQFSNVNFYASLCTVSPTFREKVEREMSAGHFPLTVTSYMTARNNITPGLSNVSLTIPFAAHDNQAFYVNFIPQVNENSLYYDIGRKWGPAINGGKEVIKSAQLMLNGRYFPPQPSQTNLDQYHDTLASFNIHPYVVDFSPMSYYNYINKNYMLGWLLDRDSGSSLTGVSSINSPVWTVVLQNLEQTVVPALNVHVAIAYSQVLQVARDGQIEIWS